MQSKYQRKHFVDKMGGVTASQAERLKSDDWTKRVAVIKDLDPKVPEHLKILEHIAVRDKLSSVRIKAVERLDSRVSRNTLETIAFNARDSMLRVTATEKLDPVASVEALKKLARGGFARVRDTDVMRIAGVRLRQNFEYRNHYYH
jgi:hypothetical protein